MTTKDILELFAVAQPPTEAQLQGRMQDLLRMMQRGLSDIEISKRYATIELVQLIREFHHTDVAH
jgi:hypothetical protein